MDWIKAVIKTTSEGVEPVLGALFSCGIGNTQIIDPSDMRRFLTEAPLQWDYVDEALLNGADTDTFVEFYLTPDSAGRDLLALVKSQLSEISKLNLNLDLGDLSLESGLVNDESWLNEWKKNYKPFHISESVVVAPVWENYSAKPGELVFTIDPGSVFGTGLHQSTRLCAEAMEEFIKPGDTLLDAGCGSGILSIIGMLLGADNVLAFDIDPAAAISTRENALRNPVNADRLTVMTGNIFTDDAIINAVSGRVFDVVTANIVADVVINLAPVIKPNIKRSGFFIASGIIDERIDDVEEALTSNGFDINRKLCKDGWYCVAAQNA